jgi:nicotinate-nucleotide adenylyltransferase
MAHAALEHLALERVLWIPTGSPGYRAAPIASAKHRLAMLRLAMGNEARFEIDERELTPHASGYTVDTLKALRHDLPQSAELYLLLGGDQYASFATWRAPEEVKHLARLAVFGRPGFEVNDATASVVPMAPMAVSASEIRARAARGARLAGLVPEAVANYIERHGLYR